MLLIFLSLFIVLTIDLYVVIPDSTAIAVAIAELISAALTSGDRDESRCCIAI